MLIKVPFRFELIRIWPQIGIPLEGKDRDDDDGPFGNGHSLDLHRGLGDSLQSIANRVEPHGLIDHHVQVLHLHQSLIGWSDLAGRTVVEGQTSVSQQNIWSGTRRRGEDESTMLGKVPSISC